MIIFTGSEDIFTSGNDLNNFTESMNNGDFNGIDDMAEFGRKMFQGSSSLSFLRNLFFFLESTYLLPYTNQHEN